MKGSNASIGLSLRAYKERYTPKWFMVRESYILCAHDIAGLEIYDVFMVDEHFSVKINQILGVHKSAKRGKKFHHHLFTVSNASRRIQLGSNSHRKMTQFIESIQYMKEHTPWTQKHRFGSFAPVRNHTQCQWIVDGRDYFWNVSRAILNARDVIYIHGYSPVERPNVDGG
jgi:phospholipase D1/2